MAGAIRRPVDRVRELWKREFALSVFPPLFRLVSSNQERGERAIAEKNVPYPINSRQFEAERTKAKVDWQVMMFGNADLNDLAETANHPKQWLFSA